MIRQLYEKLFGRRPPSLPEQIRLAEQQLQLRALQAQLDVTADLRETFSRENVATQEAASTAVPATYYDQLVDPREPLYDETDFWLPLGYSENLPTNLDNRKRGEVLPIYLTEYGLKVIRDMSRKQCAFNEFAINALENRISYICGKGMQYQCLPKSDLAEDPSALKLAAQAQACLDSFVALNGWGEMEQECVRRVDRDGEAFLRLFHTGMGRVEARFVEPEWVRSPADYGYNSVFGIETDPEDIETVTGYWIVENPPISFFPALVEPNEIVHIRLNVDRNSKRGVPTFLPIRKNLDRADRLLRNISVLAQIQATFALVRRHKQFSGSAIQTFQQGSADVAIATPVTGQTKYLQQLPPGSIIDASQNTEYEFPAVGVNAGALVEILQAELRAIASRLVMPEYMLSSDASNNNFASSMVAEAPAVRNFERLQAFYARQFGDGGYIDESHAGVMWRVLRCAVMYGELDPNVLRFVRIQAEGPSLVVRDKDKETIRNKTLAESGVLSRSTWSKLEGLDYEQEQRQIDREGGPGLADDEDEKDEKQDDEKQAEESRADMLEHFMEAGA